MDYLLTIWTASKLQKNDKKSPSHNSQIPQIQNMPSKDLKTRMTKNVKSDNHIRIKIEIAI